VEQHRAKPADLAVDTVHRIGRCHEGRLVPRRVLSSGWMSA
jgi:hypothetical protein